MNHTCFSRARYTLPNLPRPRGFPMSKSVSDHRFSCFPPCCAPSWPSCYSTSNIRNGPEEQGMGMDKSRAPSFPFYIIILSQDVANLAIKTHVEASTPWPNYSLLRPVFEPAGLEQPLQLKKKEPEGRRRKWHVSVSHSFLLLHQSIHTPVGIPNPLSFAI